MGGLCMCVYESQLVYIDILWIFNYVSPLLHDLVSALLFPSRMIELLDLDLAG